MSDILDRKGLHPTGGYCTCFSKPWSRCETCARVKLVQEHWEKLTPEERAEAEKEYARQYPRTSNQDGR